MNVRVEIKPQLLRWACERAGYDPDTMSQRIPKFTAWMSGEVHPTLKQVEGFAKVTHAPIGYLFLQEPPIENIPIPDLRTVGNIHIGNPSPDLLDTIYLCQQRQEWYRDYARSTNEKPLPFVGSTNTTVAVDVIAERIRNAIGFDLEERRQIPTWTEALRKFIGQADDLGILVMVNGVAGNNNRRKLDPEEFRGFALVDDLAPLVFINGADTKAAQMFTLAHELVHIWAGQSGLSDVDPKSMPTQPTENWCNQVAAEILVPLEVLRNEYQPNANLQMELGRLARYFKVSTLVVLRRIFDAGNLTQEQFWRYYRGELNRLRSIPRGSGGNFYYTPAARVGKRFACALIVSTLEGQTLHRDAFRLLGFSKLATFRDLGFNLGVI